MTDGQRRQRRLGLFGGSFDPVHAGHLHAARTALSAFDLDRVVFVPAAQSPHKLGRRMADGAARQAMLEIAIRGEPRFCTSDLELRRGGASYTIDTVRELPSVFGEAPDVELYLIVGSDNLPGLSTWRSARELLERVQPIVVHRDGEPEALLDAIERAFGGDMAAKVRAGYLRLPPVVASSTALRGALPALAADGRAPDVAELDPLVLDYIQAHGLYGTQR